MAKIPRTWHVAGLLLGSGFCALVYQICWLREFRLVFGASTAASAAVLAIFSGGLGIGSLVLGPLSDGRRHPLRFYAVLEAAIAVSAAVSPFLLALVRSLYIASGGSTTLGVPLATVMRLALCAIVLAVPTFAMGGTLPAAARAATQTGNVRGRAVAALYGLNTLGAVIGTLLATFFLLERFGTRGTLWVAAAINVVIAVVAAASDRSADDRVDTSRADDALLPTAVASATEDRETWAPTGFILAASATVGFAFFLMELVWYRLLAPLLGGSVFTFGLVLAVALLGIGLGGLAYVFIAGDRRATMSSFATSCLLEALCVGGTFAMGDRLAVLTVKLQPPMTAGFLPNVAGWAVIATIVVLPAALVAGYQFPLLIALFGRERRHLGREVGLVCAANTFGAIAGSLAGGFGFLPRLTAQGAWRLVAVALLALGSLAAVRSGARERRWRTGFTHAFVGAVVIVALLAEGPTAAWRHSGIGARRAPTATALDASNNLRAWRANMRNMVVWEGDGVESGVALVADSLGYAFILNGKADGSARGDAGTQVMLGVIAAINHPNPRTALVVGLGTGSSAGWLAAIPAMERVDVVELEPLILDVARACSAVNHGVMANPKVSIAIGDAREALLTGRQQYDIIASEPSNPFRAGVASLFTQEFYRAASQRLTDDGVFAQWVQSYEIDPRTLGTIYATMQTVFAEVETWETQRGDLVLLGTRRPRPYAPSRLRKRIAEEPYRSALAYAWRAVDEYGLLAHYVGGSRLAQTLPSMVDAAVNTDDRNVVEFGLARSVGHRTNVASEVRTLARQIGDARPSIENDQNVQWAVVDTAWISYSSEQGGVPDATRGPRDEETRRDALRRYLQTGDAAIARLTWQSRDSAPHDLNELAMIADIEVHSDDLTRWPLVERLGEYQPGEAETIRAAARLHQSRPEEAVDALEKAFGHFRVSPWASPRYQRKALDIASRADLSPSLTRRVFDALEQPFANLTLNEVRLSVRLELAMKLPQRDACLASLAAFGQRLPWDERALRSRRDCYQITGDRRLADASRELTEFLGHTPPSLPPTVASASIQ